MAKDEFKEHSLPKGFTQRVVSFAEIITRGEGKDYTFQFAHGVRAQTHIDKVFQDKSQLHLLICGPTELSCHSIEPYPKSYDSFVLVPSALVTIRQTEKATEVGLEHGELSSSYEMVGPDEPKYKDKTQYISSPVSTGTLDISQDDCFAFIRIGKARPSYQYIDPEGCERTWYAGPEDIYVSKAQLRYYQLQQDDVIKCTWRRSGGNERFRSAVEILAVNQAPPELNQQ